MLRICVSIACHYRSIFITIRSFFLSFSCFDLIMLCGVARSFISFCEIHALFRAFSDGLTVIITIFMIHHFLNVTLIPMLIFTASNVNFPLSRDSFELTMIQLPCGNVHSHFEFVPICHSISFFLPKHSHKLCKLIICACRSLSHQFCFLMFWIFRALISMIYWPVLHHKSLWELSCILFRNRSHCPDIVMEWC